MHRSLSLLVIYLSLMNVCFGGGPPLLPQDNTVASASLPTLPRVQYEDIGNGEVKAKKSEVIAKELAEAEIKMVYAAAMRETAALLRQSAEQLNRSTQTSEADRIQKVEDTKKLKVIEEHMVAQHNYGVETKGSLDRTVTNLNTAISNEMATQGQLQAAYGTINYTQNKLQRMARTSWIPILGPLMNMGD